MIAEQRPTRLARWPFAILAYTCAGLALAGVVLPGLPTVPFLLVAGWAATRGSERLHRRLYHHRRLGPLLRSWEEERAVPARAKWTAVVLLTASWLTMYWHSDGRAVPLVTAALFLTIATYVVSRPSPRRAVETAEE